MQNVKSDNAPVDVCVKALRKEFFADGRSLQVIDGLSFSVIRGCLIAIVGPSGCGKSTLLRILSGAERATSGTFNIDESRAAHSASIEQSPALFPWRTAFQNAHVGAEIRKARLEKEDPSEPVNDRVVSKRICESFDKFELRGFENSFPSELSGGMQQRVAIIRALESEPRMLFCDEPFSAIDFVTRLSLNTKFKIISRTLGCTTLFITHNIEEAIFLADRILVLSRRPCRIIDDFVPQLSVHPEDAVKCRKSPEFATHFDRIWRKLKPEL